FRSDPVAYRFAWGRMPWANVLTNGGTSDLPLPTMRSDDWPMEMVPLGVFEGDRMPEPFNRGHGNQVRRALESVDLERRLFEARRLLEAHGGE
ncbi:MAG: hypothetical protein KDA28_08515, partial [Phycisphaerales bacterium]|nr:hypothetical protein [Phycisphaerales bacterium]